ncbi:MAG: OpgC domain-containing protein [Alphaproteobacteria bacterium]|nr:OpgC domain-containing protein [Alphaproteobacteria bacterium]
MDRPSVSPKTPRILAVDFWRGVCLLMIFIDHIPGNPLAAVTLRSWGYADAAEIFVFLAGVSAFLSFGRFFDSGDYADGFLRCAVRTWQLFRAHILLVFGIAAIVGGYGLFADASPFIGEFNLDPLFHDPGLALPYIAVLRYMPSMSDILPIYILFVAGFPAMWFLMRRSPFLLLALSFALWLTANISGYNFPNYPEGRRWFLNPLAWQLMFASGMAVAAYRQKLAPLARSNLLLAACIAVATVGVVAAAPWTHYKPWAAYRVFHFKYELMMVHKSNLFPPRVSHFFALLVIGLRVLPSHSPFWETRFARALITTGRHALPVYCAGVLLSLVIYMLLQTRQANTAEILLVNMAGAALLIGLAALLEKIRSRGKAAALMRIA